MIYGNSYLICNLRANFDRQPFIRSETGAPAVTSGSLPTLPVATGLTEEENDLPDENVLEDEEYLNAQQAMIEILRRTCADNLTGQKCRLKDCTKQHLCIKLNQGNRCSLPSVYLIFIQFQSKLLTHRRIKSRKGIITQQPQFEQRKDKISSWLSWIKRKTMTLDIYIERWLYLAKESLLTPT